MAWENSNRRSRLPKDWSRIQKRILRRDHYMCQVKLDSGEICGAYSFQVDHIIAGDDHRDSNLRAICDWHHKAKSSSEGGVARAKRRRAASAKFIREESHPGLL